MCDNLPSINADQLTRAVAGTLSALDAPEEDETLILADDNGTSKKKPGEEKSKDGKNVQGSKSSLQLLECLSASIDPNISKLQELNKAHMTYTPSTSFYGRARKMTTKKKALEEAKSNPQSKKYSSRTNYKLIPPHLPNHMQGNASHVMLQSQVVKLCSNTKTQQGLSDLQPVGLPIGSASAKPVFVMQTSQFVPFLSTNSVISTNASSVMSNSVSSNVKYVSSEVTPSSELTLLKQAPSSSCQTLTISSPTNYTLNSSPQAISLRPSVEQVSDGTKCLTSKLIPLPQANSVIQFPVPLTVTSSKAGGSNASLHMVRLAPCLSPESNVAISPASGNVRSDCAGALKSPGSPFGAMTKGTAAIVNQNATNSTISNNPVNEILMKSIMSHNQAQAINVLPSPTNLNNVVHTNNSKGHVGIRPVNSSSLLFSSSETHRLTQSISRGLTSPKSKPVSFASCPQIYPRISAINSLNTVSHVSCGPILILPSQTIQLPAKIASESQVVFSVPPSPVCSSAPILKNMNITSTYVSGSSQASVSNPVIESKSSRPIEVVTANKGQVSHPNIIKLLQASSSIPRENIQDKKGKKNVTSFVPCCTQSVSSSSLIISSAPVSRSIAEASSHSVISKSTAAEDSDIAPSPSKPISPTSLNGPSCVFPQGRIQQLTYLPSALSAPTLKTNLSKHSVEVNTNAVTAVTCTAPSSPAHLFVKPATTPRMQLTVVTDPFGSKHLMQNSNTRHSLYVIPNSSVLQMDQKNLGPHVPKSCATVLSPPVSITSTSSERNISQTTSCFTAPISTSVSRQTKKEPELVNPVNVQSKPPHLNPVPAHNLTPAIITTGNDRFPMHAIQSPTVSSQPARTFLPSVRFPPRSSVGGSIQIPTLGSKLVLSPAGISQLQSLMRKQGMSEGYFIISAKRGAAALAVNKDSSVKRPCLSQTSNSPISTASLPLISSHSRSLASPSTLQHFEKLSPSSTVLMSSAGCLISRPLMSQSVITTSTVAAAAATTSPLSYKETTTSCISGSQVIMSSASLDKSKVSSSIGKQSISDADSLGKDVNDKENESQRSSGEESDDREGESDNESVFSSDSESSSVALVIETNYDSDHKRIDDGTPNSDAVDERSTANETNCSEKDVPLNLSKDMATTFAVSIDKEKPDVSLSSEGINDLDHRDRDNESLPQSPHENCHLLDSMRNGNLCVPQSPLSLTEIIRQQQYKFGLGFPPIPSPHFVPNKGSFPPIHGASAVMGDKADHSATSYASSEIPFSISDSCSSSYTLLSQHTITDQQAAYERSLNTPHSFYPHDIVCDDHVHDSSDLEAAMNLQRLRECLPPMSSSQVEEVMPPSSAIPSSVTSPKSPLLLSSMHQMEGNTNINPPMTPNTMLINLLNRVPTPLLTNHHDLLTNPSSHENEIRLVDNEQASMVPSQNKGDGHQILQKAFGNQKNPENVISHQTATRETIFDTSSPKIIPTNSDVFVHPQNALDMIASNYLPQSKEEMINTSDIPLGAYSATNLTETLAISSKSCRPDLFSDCAPSNMTLAGPDYCLSNYSSSMPSTTHQNCYHAISCPGPLTVTVNLDCDAFTGSADTCTTVNQERVTASASDYVHGENMEQESLTSNFSLHPNSTHEKCGEAEILRHLIQNTNTSCHSQLHQHPQQSIGLQFDANAALYTPQIPESQFESEMSGSFMQLNQPSATLHKNLTCSESLFDVVSLSQNISFSMSLPPESSMETYSHMDNGSLQATAPSLRFTGHSTFENVQINSENDLQTDSFNNGPSIRAYESNPDTSFKPSADTSFQPNSNPDFSNSQRDPSFQAESSGAFIMPNSLSDIQTSFSGSLEKNEAAMHSKFLDDNQKIHLSDFREDGEQNEIFFGQSNPSESQTQSNDLHLYDIGSMHHSSHDIAYQISTLQDHQRQLDNHQGVVQQVHESGLPQNVLGHQHDLQSHHTKDLQGHHFNFQGQTPHQYPDSTAPTFSDHQGDMGFIQEPPFSHFYTNSVEPNVPLYTQHCAVGSEAPMLMSISNLNCPIPPYSTASDLQFQYHAEEVSNESEKHPVLPSASFSPPSVADQAATPDSGNMNLYNGSFQNMTVYDMYVRGGNTESRSQMEETPVESGNFCVECNIMYKTQCKFHPCDYVYVSDMPILSHARLTLPACLKLAMSSVHGHTNTMGVFSKEKLLTRIKFGPLIGSMVSCDKLGSTRCFSLWQTFSGKNVRVIDTTDENSSNWLMFVKPARVSAEQNLVAFQHGNNIYFVTRCEVEEGQELLYWFSKDYARMLGITAKPKTAQHQLCPHCHICKQVFADRKQVRNHIRLQHPKPHINKCSHCSRRFSQVSHLNAHVLAVHLRLKKFICNHCGKRFNDSSNLRKHIKSHSEERNFKCQMCGKAFRQKAHLQIHMNTHMPVKHEQCGFCGERFTRTFERKQHELQHTKQQKIECQHCSKVFYKQKVYKEHLKIHRNERNFPCSYCGKAFRNKFALTRHGPACKQRKRTLTLAPTSSASLPPMHGSSVTQ